MSLFSYVPRLPLSRFVEAIWLADGYVSAHTRERILPTGASQLVINLRDDRFSVFADDDQRTASERRGSVFCGPRSDSFVIDGNQQTSVLGVQFKPGQSFPFAPVPISELHGAQVNLDDLWGPQARELRDLLLEAKTPPAKFHLMEETLLERALTGGHAHPAVDFALGEFLRLPHARSVRDVGEQLGYSERHFIQLFREQVGLTPKLFCRVRRFQEVLRLVTRGDRINWLTVALSCGYYDQAHFIGDFRAFSGVNPTAYLTCRGEHPNHLPQR